MTIRYATCLCCLIALFLPGCGDLFSPDSDGELVRLNVAEARWDATNLRRYSIQQTRVCECPSPHSYRAIVEMNDVDSLVYDETHEGYADGSDRRYRTAVENAITVDEAFEEIKRAYGEEAELRVDYHEEYGYPTEIYIDRHADYVDDEITWVMSDLKPRE